MHECTYKQYIFRSYNSSTFNAVRFDESPFTWQSEKDDKKAKGFKFCACIGRFQVTAKGLNMCTVRNSRSGL